MHLTSDYYMYTKDTQKEQCLYGRVAVHSIKSCPQADFQVSMSHAKKQEACNIENLRMGQARDKANGN